MQRKERIGILLANTGTPLEPEPRAVRKYLSKFLMDKRIAPMNRFCWWLILHLFILPKRGVASAEKYRAIWTSEGSPFTVAHYKLARSLEDQLQADGFDALVRPAMSYGEPLIRKSLRALKEASCTRIIVLPLYPQSAFSTTGAVCDGIQRALTKEHWQVPFDFIDNYHDHPTYTRAIAASLRHAGFREDSQDKVLFSYHSIPLSNIEAGDTYELQCGASSLQIASDLGLDRLRWTIGYQCRFDKGREWLSPYTSDILERWADVGVARTFFICPGFSVDCLETLYDITYEIEPFYRKKVLEAGHREEEGEFIYVPCLDRSRAHVKVLSEILYPYLEKAN